MASSPFTSQGYPFRKDLSIYDPDSLGRAFFADGAVGMKNGLRIYDAISLLLAGPAPETLLRYDPYWYQGREVAVYVYVSDIRPALDTAYELLALGATEAAIFAWAHDDMVDFRLKLGAMLLSLSRLPNAAATAQLRVVRNTADAQAIELSGSRLLSLFDLSDEPLLDPLNVKNMTGQSQDYSPVISRYEIPGFVRKSLAPLGYKPKQVDVTVELFFDGTRNNRYCSELIYNQAIDGNSLLFNKEKINDFRTDKVVDNPYHNNKKVNVKDFMVDKEEDGSYQSPYSNITLLHDLYQTKPYQPNPYMLARKQVIMKHYVQGIGTRVRLGEDGLPLPDGYEKDDVLGSASGRGERGIIARVEEGLAHVASQLHKLLTDAPDATLGTLTFDVFGFSRGAAAARHCINELLQPGKGDVAPYGVFGRLLAKHSVLPPRQLTVRFAGLFDTVVSDIASESYTTKKSLEMSLLFNEPSEQFYEKIHNYEPIYTSLKRMTGKVLHIIAMDEFRLHFPLTVSDAPDTYNLYLYGAHSDIGGGYAETDYTTVAEYADMGLRLGVDRATMDKALTSYRKRFCRRLVQGKWVDDKGGDRQVTLEKKTTHSIQPNASYPGLVGSREQLDHYVIIDKGPVSNKMSLVALNAMLQYALQQGLPFEPDPVKAKVPNPKFYAFPTDTPALLAYCDAVLKAVQDPKSNKLNIPPDVYYPLSTRYVHVSHNYNRALVTHQRGLEYNLYANELSEENMRLPMVNADATASKKRQYLRPASRED